LEPITCKMCGLAKSRELYYRQAKKRNGVQSWCKQCTSDYNHETYRAKHPVVKRPGSWRRGADPRSVV
jgi:hypothetical protein